MGTSSDERSFILLTSGLSIRLALEMEYSGNSF